MTSVTTNVTVLESVEKFTIEYAKNVEENRQSRMHFESQTKELIKLRKEGMDSNICKENKLLQILKNEMEIKIRKEDDMIMTTDTSNMNPTQLQLFNLRLEENFQRHIRQSTPSGSASDPS